jgi:hypothetical protein
MNKEFAIAMNKWVFFAMNYPYNFIEQVWEGNDNLVRHLKAKFNAIYDNYGSRAVMNSFYCELDGENKQKLLNWVADNFNDEQKLHFND